MDTKDSNLTVDDVFNENENQMNSSEEELTIKKSDKHVSELVVETETDVEIEPTMNKVKKKNSKIIFFAVAALIITLVTAGGYFIWNSMQRTDLNYFDSVEIEVTGINGDGVLIITSKPNITFADGKLSRDETQAFFEGVKMAYTVNGKNEDGGLKNGDEVVITLDESEPMLEKYKVRYIETTYSFTVEGLIEMPATWNDVKDKNVVIQTSAEMSDVLYKYIVDGFTEQVNGQFEVNTDLNQLGVVYKTSSPEVCSDGWEQNYFEIDDYCGNAFVIYEVTFHLPSDFYFTDNASNKMMYAIPVTGIVNDGEVTEAKYGNLDSNLYDNNQYPTLEELIGYFEGQGFTYSAY